MASNIRTAGMIADNQWFVSEIIAQRIGADFLLEPLVVWEGYPVEEATWEPPEHIHSDLLSMWFREKNELVDVDYVEEEMAEADRQTIQDPEAEESASEFIPDDDTESEGSASEFTPDDDTETSESEYDSEQDADFEWDN